VRFWKYHLAGVSYVLTFRKVAPVDSNLNVRPHQSQFILGESMLKCKDRCTGRLRITSFAKVTEMCVEAIVDVIETVRRRGVRATVVSDRHILCTVPLGVLKDKGRDRYNVNMQEIGDNFLE
jgi:hypothetical protein